MELLIDRKWKRPTYTIGILYVNGERFCETLEDTDRGLSQSDPDSIKKKVKGKTAIPTGRYKVAITYSPRFKRSLPLVENVPGFEGIRIHPGNTDRDTEGCILVGENRKKGMVLNSRVWFNKLFDMLVTAWKNREKLRLEIR